VFSARRIIYKKIVRIGRSVFSTPQFTFQTLCHSRQGLFRFWSRGKAQNGWKDEDDTILVYGDASACVLLLVFVLA